MFLNTSFYPIFGPTLAVVVVASLILRVWINRQPTELRKAIANMRLVTVASGVLLLLLWFLLPSTPSLSTFGFPQSQTEIQSPERLLQFLQQYNRALVRTTEVLHWFIFVFVWWFLTAIYSLTKALRHVPDSQSESPSVK